MIGYLTIDTNNLIDRMSAYTYAYADKYDKLTDDIFNCLKSHIKKGNDFIVYMNKKEDMIKAYAKANIVEAKEVVNDYGIFKIMKKYVDYYGFIDYKVCEEEDDNYINLYSHFIIEYIDKYHCDKIKKIENRFGDDDCYKSNDSEEENNCD